MYAEVLGLKMPTCLTSNCPRLSDHTQRVLASPVSEFPNKRGMSIPGVPGERLNTVGQIVETNEVLLRWKGEM